MANTKALAYALVYRPFVRRVIEKIPYLRRLYSGWRRTHPFDRDHGTETSGFIPVDALASDPATRAKMIFYAGSQPSIVRATLALLPDPERYAFVDLGCGKGRTLIVASEFSFRQIVGVEIVPSLAAIATANAAIISARYPRRTPIEVRVGDATAVTPPSARVVYFIYHSLPKEAVATLIGTIEQQLDDDLHQAFLIYYNPVWGEIVDRSPRLTRWSAETVRYDQSEIGFGPDLEDAVVVWQSKPDRYKPRNGADRRISVTKPSLYAEIEPRRPGTPTPALPC